MRGGAGAVCARGGESKSSEVMHCNVSEADTRALGVEATRQSREALKRAVETLGEGQDSEAACGCASAMVAGSRVGGRGFALTTTVTVSRLPSETNDD